MEKERYLLSSYILHSLMEGKTNRLYDKVVKVLFRGIEFDQESLQTLKDYQDKGKIVFASFQSSTVSLLILNTLLRRHNLKVPYLAFDYQPCMMQMTADFFRRAYVILDKLFAKKKYENVSDLSYLDRVLAAGRSMAVSMITKETFLVRYLNIRSDILQNLVELQKTVDEPIFVFPQIIFWNRNPERTRMLVTSRATGSYRFPTALATHVLSVTPAFMRIGAPLNLKDEMKAAPSDDPRKIARFLRDKLLDIYGHEKRVILGPVIKTKQEMMEKILYHRNILDVISQVAAEKKVPERRLRKKAYSYFNEIAADFSIVYIKLFERTLRLIFSKIFRGIHLNIEDLTKLRDAAQKGPLIIMPSHKSHMDYLIISSLFYRHKLIPPHILAGQNLTFFPMGHIFRRSGAFFMRRSFKGLDLYAAIFKQYIKTLINEGYSIEFFIEGTRTRSGKVNLPKMGIMKYLIDAIEEGYNYDMVFVPMTINYDRVLEESSYQHELRGREKKDESTGDFVKSSKLLKRNYGKVYLSFSEPVSYLSIKEMFKDDQDPVGAMSYYLTRKINDVIMVTPFALASASILMQSVKGFTRDTLKEKMVLFLDYLKYSKAVLSDEVSSKGDLDTVIETVIDSYKTDNIIQELKIEKTTGKGSELLEGVYALKETDRARISFYKNNIIHYLLPICFTAQALLVAGKGNAAGAEIAGISEVFLKLKELMSREFIYPAAMDETDAIIANCIAFFEKKAIVVKEKDAWRVAPGKEEILATYARLIQDFLESYFVVARTVCNIGKKTQRKDLVMEVRKNGVRMYHLEEIKLIEALSMPNYNNAIDQLIGTGILKQTNVSRKNADIEVMHYKKARVLMGEIKEYLGNAG